MIAAFALKLMEWFALDAKSAKWLAWAIAIVALLAVLGIGKCTYDANVIGTHEANTSAKLERTGRKADASAAQRAEARRRAEAAAREEFDNATSGLPDNGLSPRQRLDICRELREAGTDTALLAECGDVRAGAEAGT